MIFQKSCHKAIKEQFVLIRKHFEVEECNFAELLILGELLNQNQIVEDKTVASS